jgi:hypothetical protein
MSDSTTDPLPDEDDDIPPPLLLVVVEDDPDDPVHRDRRSVSPPNVSPLLDGVAAGIQ